MNYQFTVEIKGKIYACERIVTGKKQVLSQQIHVVGVGIKTDPVSYGMKQHPVNSMETTARIIAHEIIRGL